ncbi:FAD-binding oxidoreductase [Roseicella aquatilis]|nr:FAD-binding oxidoreductase [Roseicella aquatilis]
MMTDLCGWGRYPRLASDLLEPRRAEEVRQVQAARTGWVARGNGRAYGDAAIGLEATIGLRALDRMRHLDEAAGTLTAEAGVTLGEVIDALLPRGWFVPAVPGTQYVTLGGMVASDVHGKNHHATGGFGAHVRALTLVLPGGEVVRCSPQEKAALFRATIGGQGLTGSITEVTFGLMRVETGWIRQRTIATPDLATTIRVLAEAEAEATYSVAWIDSVARGARLGRGAVFLGEHATRADLAELAPGTDPRPRHRPARLGMSFDLPGFTLNRLSVGAFNELYWRKAAATRGPQLSAWSSYFFPLDGITDWNRMYGPRGFVQHQCVIPAPVAQDAVAEILRRVAAAGTASFLAVLKSLAHGHGLLSFPMPGLTLALDIRMTEETPALLAGLDRLVVEAGGRLYLAKDACQSPATFEAGYPALGAFRAIRREIGAEGRVTSRLSARLGI